MGVSAPLGTIVFQLRAIERAAVEMLSDMRQHIGRADVLYLGVFLTIHGR